MNEKIKELEPVIIKITPTLITHYSTASCIGDYLNKLLFKGEKEVVWRVMPWYDGEKKAHFCYELKMEIFDDDHPTRSEI